MSRRPAENGHYKGFLAWRVRNVQAYEFVTQIKIFMCDNSRVIHCCAHRTYYYNN